MPNEMTSTNAPWADLNTCPLRWPQPMPSELKRNLNLHIYVSAYFFIVKSISQVRPTSPFTSPLYKKHSNCIHSLTIPLSSSSEIIPNCKLFLSSSIHFFCVPLSCTALYPHDYRLPYVLHKYTIIKDFYPCIFLMISSHPISFSNLHSLLCIDDQ